MIYPTTQEILAAVLAAEVVAKTHDHLPKDLSALPALAVEEARLRRFSANEGATLLQAAAVLALLLVTPLAGTNGGAEKASLALEGLTEVLLDGGFMPEDVTQVQANWGRHEVFITRVVAARTVTFART